jgi:MFS family permease
MAGDRYISFGRVSGLSFANMGLFTGFADGIYNAVYSLVILSIFQSSAIVGIYVALYSAFCMFVGLFANEVFRRFSKVRVFYTVLLALAVGYAMMSFSIQPETFITLDFTTGIAITLSQMLIPLFMADFAGKVGIARINARYHLWLNIGALFAPMIAVTIAGYFGIRSAFMASSFIYIAAWLFFRWFHIVQPDKEIKPVNPRRTMRALWRNTRLFFKTPGMLRAYLVNFGYYSLRAVRLLYVPIVIIESGFSKDTLGLVLTLGIIPYIVLSEIIGRLVRKYGKNIWLILGFASFAILAAAATLVGGYPLLAIFVLWQFSGALMEPVHDLLFFDNVSPAQQTRFYGVFRTSVNLPNIIAPTLAAACITFFGATSAVWFIPAVIGALTVGIIITPHK